MTDYKKQGEDFLTETGTTMEVVETVPQKSPLWCKEGEKHGIQYAVKLKNERYSYTFDFWGSIADAEMLDIAKDIEGRGFMTQSPRAYKLADFLSVKQKGYSWTLGAHVVQKTKEAIKPDAYTVLSCLNVFSGDTFEDFCGDFGYDVDSIQAEKTYRAVQEQDRALRRLFTMEQLEKLQEIA